MRLRRQLFQFKVHTTDEARRPITATLAGLHFDCTESDARQLALDLADAIEVINHRRETKA